MKPQFTSYVVFNSVHFSWPVRSPCAHSFSTAPLPVAWPSPSRLQTWVHPPPTSPPPLSAVKSASFPLPPQPHSGLTLAHGHKASFDSTSLRSNLLSLRGTKNIPHMLPSHHFLALKLAEALNCPQIKSQFLSVVKVCG